MTPTDFEYGLQTPIAFPMTTNAWVHIAIVKNGTSFAYYQNGVRVASGSLSASNASVPFFIGGEPVGPDGFVKGKIDDVRIYNRALSATEVKQLYGLGTVTMHPN